MSQHSKLYPGAGGVHTILAYEYSNSTERVSATGFDARDVGKVAKQLNDGSLWILKSFSPIVWGSLGEDIPVAQTVEFDHTTGALMLGAVTAGQTLCLGQITLLSTFTAGSSVSFGTSADPAMFLLLPNPQIGSYGLDEYVDILVDDVLLLTVVTVGATGNGKLLYEVRP